jgi:O-antigen/teichoic acid export membrane protein
MAIKMDTLKEIAVWSGIYKLFGLGATTIVRVCYLAILARQLSPNDFGLVAMVTVVTGLFEIFSSAGLAWATIQKTEITDQQISQLFWVNVLVGVVLALLCASSAPLLTRFYQEPQLFWIVIALAPGFLLTAAGVQHSALLQRDLRHSTVTAIETLSQFASAGLGVALALVGCGYWALVFALIAGPAINTAGCWVCTRWLPGRPRSGVEIRSLLGFGGTLTVNSLVVYLGYNLEKVILGRFWGADVLGLYTRAVQLANLPVTSLNSAIGGVAFSVLSRLQDDPARFRSYFLRAFSLVNTVTVPATMFSAVFADEIVWLILSPKWLEASIIFRLITPTILVFGVINPLAWILLSTGLQKRSLQLGLVIAPLVIAAYSFGLNYGPAGVAFSYSAIMVLWLVPHVAWALHGTPISIRDLAQVMAGPFLAGVVASACAFEACQQLGQELPAMLRLALGGTTMAVVYGGILVFFVGHRALYADVLAALRRRRSLV